VSFCSEFCQVLHYKSITAGVSGWCFLLSIPLAPSTAIPATHATPFLPHRRLCVSHSVSCKSRTFAFCQNAFCTYKGSREQQQKQMHLCICQAVCVCACIWLSVWVILVVALCGCASANNDRQHKQTRTSDSDWRLWPQGQPQKRRSESQDAGHAHKTHAPIHPPPQAHTHTHTLTGLRRGAGFKLGTSLVSAFCT